MPLAHISLPVSDLQASKAFYLKLLKPLGYETFLDLDATVGMGPRYGNPDFWMHTRPEDASGGGAQVQKTHVAFQAPSRAVVRAFHEIAMKSGASCNGPPGERTYTKGYYAAFILDPDGNNIECVHYQPLWLTILQKAPLVLGTVVVGAASWWAGKQGWMLSG